MSEPGLRTGGQHYPFWHDFEIASDLRSAGLVPATTDLSHAARNGLI